MKDNNNQQHYFETNRRLWDLKTPIHEKSSFYDLQAFMAGKSSLNPLELEGVGEVKGRSLLHLQCHFGMDSLSWAREGAKVTAVDFSGKAIQLANSLRDQLGLDARFIEANVYDLEQHLDETFDIVFTSYGAICWLPDLAEWARLCARYLRPGGTFYMAEFHPAIHMLDWNKLEIAYSYFNTGQPYEEINEGTYADPGADMVHNEYFWNHSLSEVMESLMAQGLTIRQFKEVPFNYYGFLPGTVKGEDGFWRYPGKESGIPLMYGLKAMKEG